ncbi:MAG: hypothetical protein JEZ06_21635 [Anaerolineaceae bacterium]|nr:hypothetical protein [Anaerolineaceae bacterium]
MVSFKSGSILLDHAILIIELENLLGIKVYMDSDGGLKERYREEIMRGAGIGWKRMVGKKLSILLNR